MNQVEHLREYRITNRLSQAKMSELMGMTQPEYSRLENGKRRLSEKNIETMAKAGIIEHNLERDITLPEMVCDAMELMTHEDQEMLFLMARRLLK